MSEREKIIEASRVQIVGQLSRATERVLELENQSGHLYDTLRHANERAEVQKHIQEVKEINYFDKISKLELQISRILEERHDCEQDSVRLLAAAEVEQAVIHASHEAEKCVYIDKITSMHMLNTSLTSETSNLLKKIDCLEILLKSQSNQLEDLLKQQDITVKQLDGSEAELASLLTQEKALNFETDDILATRASDSFEKDSQASCIFEKEKQRLKNSPMELLEPKRFSESKVGNCSAAAMQLAELIERFQLLQSQSAAISNETIAQLEGRLVEQEYNCAQYRSETCQAVKDLKEKVDEIDSLHQDLQICRDSLVTSNLLAEKRLTDIEILRTHYDDSMAVLMVEKAEFECQFNAQASSHSIIVEDINHDLSGKNKRIEELEKQLQRFREDVESSCSLAEERLENIESLRSEHDATNATNGKVIDELQSFLAEHESMHALALDSFRDVKTKLSEKVAKLQERLFDASKEKATLRRMLEQCQDECSLNNSLANERFAAIARLQSTQERSTELFRQTITQLENRLTEKQPQGIADECSRLNMKLSHQEKVLQTQVDLYKSTQIELDFATRKLRSQLEMFQALEVERDFAIKERNSQAEARTKLQNELDFALKQAFFLEIELKKKATTTTSSLPYSYAASDWHLSPFF
jgi:chromosome segregation ATPase